MLQDKITNKISELQNNFSSNQLRSSSIFQMLKSLKLSANFAEFNFLKKQGYAFNFVLSLFIWMTIQLNKTINASLAALSDNGISIGKDVYYCLKNSANVCWWPILWYIVNKFLQQTQKNSEKTANKTEKTGKVFDHVKQRMVLGFRLLTGLYFDGTSAIPVDFSLVREKEQRADKPFGLSKKYLRRRFSKKRAKESEGSLRVKELDISKIELSIQMFLRAIFHGIPVDYVLCDSWFTCFDLLAAVRQKGSHLIGMYKIVKTKFGYRGKRLN